MTILCIYHGNCADGFGAAWVVRKALGEENVEFCPGVYQEPPPNVTARDVIICDFSYKRPVIEEMTKVANSILILDHHKSAAMDLFGLPPAPAWDIWEEAALNGTLSPDLRTVAQFDMERSGAGIAWDYFFPDEPRPKLISHIEDRDLWRFNLPFTREIQAAVFSYPYDFVAWDELFAKCERDELTAEGVAIERKHHKDIAELIGVMKRRMNIAGYNVPVASLPYTFTSDAGHLMAQGEPFAACYYDTEDYRVFSLRSTDEGVDVSEIAKKYGGGGHRNAAGFRVRLLGLGHFDV